MKAQLDQSGRVEYTSHNTVLAFSNEVKSAIFIPAQVKRELQKLFREDGKSRLFVYRTFAAGIVLLIKDYLKKIDSLVIDTEYTGQGQLIRDMIFEMLKKLNYRKMPNIYFRQIGKKSEAHRLAHRIFQKKQSADKIISLSEIKKLAL